MGYSTVGEGPVLINNSIVTLVLTWAFFSVRIYTRWFLMKIWKVEDWLYVGGQVCFTILGVSALEAAVHGNGQKNSNIALEDIPIAMKFWFICEVVYLFTILLIRLSIGFFILRIMTRKRYIYTIHIAMAIISLVTVMDLFFTIFQCAPVDYFWLQFSGLKGKCLPALLVQNVAIAYAAIAAVTDILFGVLPIIVIWNLKMNRKAKIIVGGLLCVGIVAGLTVFVRIEYIRRVSLTEDFLFATANVSIWSMIEPAIALCCMSASTWRPLFKSLRDKSTVAYGSKAQTAGGYNFNNSNGARIRQSGNFGPSRSIGGKNGYLKSSDTKNTNSYEDDIAMESMAVGPTRGRKSDSDEESKGILASTTVEITRHDKSNNIV